MTTTHRTPSLPPPAQAARFLAARMGNEENFLPVIQTAVLDCGVKSPESAWRALEAFLQWFSLLPQISEDDHFVMLKGDVDRVWHAAIINTFFYRHLCTAYIGRFVDHSPSLATPKAVWVLGTVARLERVFGNELNPVFVRWRAEYSTGTPL